MLRVRSAIASAGLSYALQFRDDAAGTFMACGGGGDMSFTIGDAEYVGDVAQLLIAPAPHIVDAASQAASIFFLMF